MKPLVRLLALAFVCYALPISAAPNYTGMNQAVTNYFAALDVIDKKLPSVDNAAGTAEMINAWALANEIFADATDQFAAQNPQIRGLPKPPEEFAKIIGRLNKLNTDYPKLASSIGKLGQQFKDDPEVLKALLRFQKSLIRLHISGELQKPTATPVTKEPRKCRLPASSSAQRRRISTGPQ
ncbi:MAG TPA: hypothetical protein VGM54_21135 [Chthoniobacter sp.]|jgi:hypothetical protein